MKVTLKILGMSLKIKFLWHISMQSEFLAYSGNIGIWKQHLAWILHCFLDWCITRWHPSRSDVL